MSLVVVVVVAYVSTTPRALHGAIVYARGGMLFVHYTTPAPYFIALLRFADVF